MQLVVRLGYSCTVACSGLYISSLPRETQKFIKGVLFSSMESYCVGEIMVGFLSKIFSILKYRQGAWTGISKNNYEDQLSTV